MSRARRSLAAVLAVVLLAATAPPETVQPVGSARLSLRLVDLAVTAPGEAPLSAGLGELRAMGARGSGPSTALLELVGATVAGRLAGDYRAEPGQAGKRTWRLPAMPGVDGTATLGLHRVMASPEAAMADLATLDGVLSAGPFEAVMGSGDPAFTARVTDRSYARTDIRLPAMGVMLGDVLPDPLVKALPLGTLLVLGDALGGVPELGDPSAQLASLLDALREVSARRVELVSTRDELLAALDRATGGSAELPAARAAVATAEAAYATAAADLASSRATRDRAGASLVAARSALAAAEADVAARTTSLRAAVTAARSSRDATAATLATREADLSAARQTATAATARVTAATTTAADAQAAVDTLTAQLATVRARITALQDERALLDALLDAVRILAIDAEIATLTSQASDLETQRTTAQGTLATATADLAAAQTAAASATAAVTAAERAVTDAATAAAQARTALTSAESALAAITAELDGPRQAVTDAETVVATADRAVTAGLATLRTTRDAVAAAHRELDRVLTTAGDLLDPATSALVDRLLAARAALATQLATADDLAAGLPDLDRLLADLRSTVTDTPLVQLGSVGLTSEVEATDVGARAVAACTIAWLQVLRSRLESPTCEGSSALINGSIARVVEVFEALPLVAVPTPTLAGLVVRTSATDGPDHNGVTRALVGVTGLRITVPVMSFRAVSDETTAELDALLADAVAAQGLIAQPMALAGSRRAAAADPQDLRSLQGQVDTLPDGSGLDGARTTGIDLGVGVYASEAVYGARAGAPLALGDVFDALDMPVDDPFGGGYALPPGYDTEGPLPAPADDPGTPDDVPVAAPAPTTPAGPVDLPTTGGGQTALLGAVAMLAAVALRRRREPVR